MEPGKGMKSMPTYGVGNYFAWFCLHPVGAGMRVRPFESARVLSKPPDDTFGTMF
jgi:hypothetical protein